MQAQGISIIESTDSMQKILEFIDWDALTDEQKWIISEIANFGETWGGIIQKWKIVFGEAIGKSALKTAILRAALSKPWSKGMKGGTEPYLVDSDLKLLETEISERAQMCKALNTITILDEAMKLKICRIQQGERFLSALKFPKLAAFLRNTEIEPPSRTWINNLQNKIDVCLEKITFVDGKRFHSCSFELIDDFFGKFSHILRATPPELLFTADETMADLQRVNKVIVPSTTARYIEPQPPDLPHITVMCATNVLGAKLPPFVILSHLKKAPPELQQVINTGMIWLASTENGWMDRWCFLLWSICFINWLRCYRAKLPTSLADKTCLLILDGHTSRENPLVLSLFRQENVAILILPASTSHVLQLFDVGLASPLKRRFSQIYHALSQKSEKVIRDNHAATVRKLAIEAFLDAWDSICSKSNCESAAAEVGLYPVDKSRPKSSPFVRDLTADERHLLRLQMQKKQKRLNINAAIITEQCKIDEIIEVVAKNVRDNALAQSYDPTTNYTEFVRQILPQASIRGSRLLSPVPPIGTMRFAPK